MKLLYLPSLILVLFWSPAARADALDDIAGLIRTGNVHELAKQFAPSVDITIADQENTYTGTQAEMTLNKFFAENRPKSVKMFHKINSNPDYLFAVLLLTTDNGVFRLSYTLQKKEGGMKIIEFSIGPEKTK